MATHAYRAENKQTKHPTESTVTEKLARLRAASSRKRPLSSFPSQSTSNIPGLPPFALLFQPEMAEERTNRNSAIIRNQVAGPAPPKSWLLNVPSSSHHTALSESRMPWFDVSCIHSNIGVDSLAWFCIKSLIPYLVHKEFKDDMLYIIQERLLPQHRGLLLASYSSLYVSGFTKNKLGDDALRLFSNVNLGPILILDHSDISDYGLKFLTGCKFSSDKIPFDKIADSWEEDVSTEESSSEYVQQLSLMRCLKLNALPTIRILSNPHFQFVVDLSIAGCFPTLSKDDSYFVWLKLSSALPRLRRLDVRYCEWVSPAILIRLDWDYRWQWLEEMAVEGCWASPNSWTHLQASIHSFRQNSHAKLQFVF